MNTFSKKIIFLIIFSASYATAALADELSTLINQAENGDYTAQLKLSMMYTIGDGVPQNEAEALKWQRRSAETGHPAAQAQLGFLYEQGQGVEQNDKEAIHWYLLSAKQGNLTAQYKLGLLYNKSGKFQNKVEAKRWLSKACENGFTPVCDFDEPLQDQKQ